MIRGARTIAVASCVAILALVPDAARAQRASQPNVEDEARLRFFNGVTLFEEGNFDGALVEFLASHELRSVPVVLFNIAQTYRELELYDDAVRTLRRYLAEGEGLAAPRRALVQRQIAELERRIAPITLEVAPAGSEIRIDSRVVGAAPLAGPLRLSAGRRLLEVTADEHLPVRDEIDVVGGRARTLEVRLARRESAATIRVTATVASAAVRIDGLDVGTPPVERRLPRGGHVVEVHAPGHQLYRASVDLAERQRLTLNAVLEQDSPPSLIERPWFVITVSVLGVGAIVGIFVALLSGPPAPIEGNSFPGVVEL